MKFIGNFEELQDMLKEFFPKQYWREISSNQLQYKSPDGVVINWSSTTGTIAFQGKKLSRSLFSKIDTAIKLKTHAQKNDERQKVVIPKDVSEEKVFLNIEYSDSELVIGLVGAVGTNLKMISEIIKDRLQAYNYEVDIINVSNDVIGELTGIREKKFSSEYERIKTYIDRGNHIREITRDNSILASGVASVIMSKRFNDQQKPIPKKRTAYIINSLKHPEEAEKLREIYTCGFYMIGVYSDVDSRKRFLEKEKRITPSEASNLIEIDEDENIGHGQHTRDTFHLSDFYIHLDKNIVKFKNSIWRILDLMFGSPFITPTFDEFAMFMAFASALRSADLSRQVGAVVAKDNEIIASGANDCPKAGGGLYWSEYFEDEIIDVKGGRDHTKGVDSNKLEQSRIVDDIVNKLNLSSELLKSKIIKSNIIDQSEIIDKLIECLEISPENIKNNILKSKIKEITEYGRIVHAEMEALLMCARNNFSARGATLYCTTFPCHNCAKHIIAAGIDRVVYVEPYPKSKAFEFYNDSITQDLATDRKDVKFIPFIGVGPRKFFELFSMSLSSGYNMIRKLKSGYIINWEEKNARLRTQMLPGSYLDKEEFATKLFLRIKGDLNDKV